MTKIGVHLIFGSNPEPFLGAALRSVEWVDYVAAVNTAPGDPIADSNERVFESVVPQEKRRYMRSKMQEFSFSQARNICLNLADNGDYVLILDADDVHYPELEQLARECVEQEYDIVTAHFWHLIGYKDLWGKEPHREILFTKTKDTKFENAVHEGLHHSRINPHLLPEYHYVHYGYIKPPSEIFSRWVLYSQLEGDPHHYDGRNPDDALAGWLESTQPFWRDHPPAAKEVLEGYPQAPASARAIDAPRNVGLVMLTWNDGENLELCLKTLATTRQPFRLVIVDNGSTDDTNRLINEFRSNSNWDDTIVCSKGVVGPVVTPPNMSLTEALNWGFGQFMHDPAIDYIGWIHPDMIFERDTWLECLRHALDTHPDIAKVGAWEMDTPRHPEPHPGNSQCYLIRKSALEQVGLFDERFEACGGYEDWEHNYRLMKVGKVMIWPDAAIRHKAMGTRSRHDNEDAARRNAELYHSIVGTWHAVV